MRNLFIHVTHDVNDFPEISNDGSTQFYVYSRDNKKKLCLNIQHEDDMILLRELLLDGYHVNTPSFEKALSFIKNL